MEIDDEHDSEIASETESPVISQKPRNSNSRPSISDTPKSPRKKPVRRPLPENLEVEEIFLSHSDICDCCNTNMKRVKQVRTEKLHLIPARLVRRVYVRDVFACPDCQTAQSPELPAQVIDKGIPTTELLTHLIINKLEYHLPWYRQQLMFSRMGCDIALSTICGWMMRVGELLLPLVNRLHEKLIESPVIHVDETPLLLFDHNRESKKKHKVSGYVWAYASSTHCAQKIIYFDCAKGRGFQYPIKILESFTGTIMVDGYVGYDTVTDQCKNIKAAGCLTHVRRKFADILKGKDIACADATYFIDQVAQLYRYEKEAKAMSDEDRLSHRQTFSAPVVTGLGNWNDDKLTITLPNSALYKALKHAESRWPSIKVYLTAGNIPIDNNHIEREIRPLTLGRKNWLFFGSYEAGKLMTGIMGLLETAKLNGLNPAKWLLDTLLKLPTWLNSRLDELLPLAPPVR